MSLHYYAIPGESDVTICEPHLQPMHTVEMPTSNPDPEIYIASHDGTWVIGDYKVARKISILKAWPVHEQLEAWIEYAEGRPDKLNKLKQYIKDIKLAYPK